MSTERPSDAVLLVLSAVALSNRYEVPVNTAIEWLRAADWPSTVLPSQKYGNHPAGKQ